MKNLQGDIIAIVNASGTKVVEYVYDAWGKLLSKTGTMASTLGTLNPFRYRGYVYDEETGLYYLRSRYYNPVWDRFVNADICMGTMGMLLSHDTYVYCKNNCITRFDASGLEDIYVFYYHRPESKASLITQAQTAIYYDSSANNVHMIEVGYSDDLVSAWNAMDDNDLSEVYFVLHGSAGRIVFDEPNGEYISFVGDGGNVSFDAFQPKKINGALYMLNCHGADSRKGQSVAEYFANLCSTNVFACVCGVSYTKMPFSKRTYAREEKKEFFNLFSFNWKWFCFEDGTLNVFTLFSKWLN